MCTIDRLDELNGARPLRRPKPVTRTSSALDVLLRYRLLTEPSGCEGGPRIVVGVDADEARVPDDRHGRENAGPRPGSPCRCLACARAPLRDHRVRGDPQPPREGPPTTRRAGRNTVSSLHV